MTSGKYAARAANARAADAEGAALGVRAKLAQAQADIARLRAQLEDEKRERDVLIVKARSGYLRDRVSYSKIGLAGPLTGASGPAVRRQLMLAGALAHGR